MDQEILRKFEQIRFKDNIISKSKDSDILYVKQWNSSLGTDALKNVEASLLEDTNNIFHKIWWILINLDSTQIPVTSLIPSLRESFFKYRELDLHFYVGLESVSTITKKLFQKKDFYAAVLLLAETAKHIKSCGARRLDQEVSDFYDLCLSIIELQIKDLEKTPSNHQKVENLKLTLSELVLNEEITEKKSELPDIEIEHSSILNKRAETKGGTLEIPPEDLKPIRSPNLLFLPLLILILLIFGAGYVSYKFILFPKPGLLEISSAPIFKFSKNGLVPPKALDQIAYNKQNSLSDLNQRLSSLNTPPTPPKIANTPQVNSTLPSTNSNIKLPKATLGTHSNIPDDKSYKPNELPKLSSTSDLFPPEDLGTGRATTSIPKPKVDPQSPFGTPPLDAKDLYGNPVKPTEVKKLKNNFYVTIVPTRVYSSPSITSSAFDKIDRDTRIEVSAILGRWLEIKSNSGKLGYIYKSDAIAER